MVAISLLFIYMSFLLCLDPIMNPSSKSEPTSAGRAARHQDDPASGSQLDNPTQECVFSEPNNTSSLQSNRQRSSAVLNLVSQEQSKWRRQV